MISNQEVQKLVGRACKSVRVSRAVRSVLLIVLIYSLLVMLSTEQADDAAGANILLIAVSVAWVVLSSLARRKASATGTAGQLIATGQIAQAQQILAGVCRGLCVHKPVLLLGCHNLAVTFQKQGQWLAAWQLCELVRGWARKKYNEIRIMSEALRAECCLAMNNLAGSYESLSVLSGMELSISERLSVLQTEVTYSVRVGHSAGVMADLENKVALAGLLPTSQAGRVHAWLALAADLAKQTARRDWLWRRARIYCPEGELLAASQAFCQVAQAVRADRTRACKNLSE